MFLFIIKGFGNTGSKYVQEKDLTTNSNINMSSDVSITSFRIIYYNDTEIT